MQVHHKFFPDTNKVQAFVFTGDSRAPRRVVAEALADSKQEVHSDKCTGTVLHMVPAIAAIQWSVCAKCGADVSR